MSINFRLATKGDTKALWEIFHEVGKGGDTFAHTRETTKEEFEEYWLAKNTRTYVVEFEGNAAATFIILQNRMGRGSHVANGAFMVHPKFHGKGIGKTMGNYAIEEAKRLGYQAMQFNFVISTNTAATNLWKSLDFNVIGTVPKGFNHAKLGMVDVLILHRFL